MLDQDENFDMITLSILITCLLDNVWIYHKEKLYVNHLGESKG